MITAMDNKRARLYDIKIFTAYSGAINIFSMQSSFKKNRPQQWSERQTEYLATIIQDNSVIRSTVEIGAGSGSVAEQIWKHIHHTGKVFHAIDNYHFIPRPHREKFAKQISDMMPHKNDNFQLRVEDSQLGEWKTYDMMISSHEDGDHFEQDWSSFEQAPGDLHTVVLDVNPHCGQRFSRATDILLRPPAGFDHMIYIDGIVVMSKHLLECSRQLLPGTMHGRKFLYAPKRETTVKAHQQHLSRLFTGL